MAVLNRKICVVEGSNVGFGDCVLEPGFIVGAIKVPKNKLFTPTDLEDFQTTLQTLANAPNPNDRIYPVHGFEQITDNSEDLTIQTLGYGGKFPTRDGDYDWTFQFLQGGICLLKSLQYFNGSGGAWLFYDSNGIFYGQKVGDDLAGIPMVFFWANKWSAPDGTNAAVFAVRFVFKPQYINRYIGFVETDFNPALITGLQDVVIREAAGSARPALKVTARTGCSNSDMFDWFGTELAVVGAWKATQGAVDITITTVAEDPNIKGWTITLDATDTDYDANSPVVLSMADPTALSGLGVTGFESRTLTIA